MENHTSNNNAVAPLVLGITALLCVFFRMGGHVLGIILGVIAVVMGNNAQRQGAGGGMATAGKTLGIITIVLCALVILLKFIIGAALAAAGLEFLRWLIR